MFVWLPRYSYKITSGNHTSTTGMIAIKWSNNITDSTDNGYILHPAYTFGGQQLKGIWVAKFETARTDATASSVGTGTSIKIVPSVISRRFANVSTGFSLCREMERTGIYGWTAQAGAINADGTIAGDTNSFDMHLMRNVEWGAVAYLTQAVGKTGEVWANSNSSYITGHAGTSVTGGGTTTDYKSANGVHASTTDNVYGIYDFVGAGREYVMGVLGTNFWSFTNAPNSKYYDSYTGTSDYSNRNVNYNSNSTKIGDALYETSSAGQEATGWYGDSSDFINSDTVWFYRGNNGLFSFQCSNGVSADYTSFRPVMTIVQ
jgi:hypothetical protein